MVLFCRFAGDRMDALGVPLGLGMAAGLAVLGVVVRWPGDPMDEFEDLAAVERTEAAAGKAPSPSDGNAALTGGGGGGGGGDDDDGDEDSGDGDLGIVSSSDDGGDEDAGGDDNNNVLSSGLRRRRRRRRRQPQQEAGSDAAASDRPHTAPVVADPQPREGGMPEGVRRQARPHVAALAKAVLGA